LRPRRRHDRFIRRLETEFEAAGQQYRAFSSDFSCSGLYIRTNHAFPPGTPVSITVHMPDGRASHLKGVVRRALRTTVVSLKNGMGIELTEKDTAYSDFMNVFAAECTEPWAMGKEEEEPAAAQPEFLIIACGSCGAKNKIPSSKLSLGPKCGKCRTPLPTAV
jgi:hypothetical protein